MKAQKTLFDHFEQKSEKRRYGRTEYGGADSKGKRKLERPLSKKRPIHLVLKSEKAKGALSFLSVKNQIMIQQLIQQKAKKFGVIVGDYANVGNHLHLKIRIQNRVGFQKFLKSITALIARKVTGAKKGKKFGKFWQGLAYTRVLKSWLEELRLKGYFEANRVEARTSAKVREMYLKAFNEWVKRERARAGP